jgi:glycosyltransferase involved in cell wall biosynthesis
MNEKISVVIPTYNRAHLLRGAIESVFTQKYDNYELLILDNASEDDTSSVVQRYSRDDDRIKYIRNSKNLGMIGNWNEGLRIAAGDYICVLMDDDRLKPNFLSETSRIITQDDDFAFVAGTVEHYRVNGDSSNLEFMADRTKVNQHSEESGTYSNCEAWERYITGNFKIGLPSAVLFRRIPELMFSELGLDPGFWIEILMTYPKYYFLSNPVCIKLHHDSEQFSDGQRKPIYYKRLIYNLNLAMNNLLIAGVDISTTTLRNYRKKISDFSKKI